MLGVPLLVLLYQSHQSGLSITQIFARIFKQALATDAAEAPAQTAHGPEIDFLAPTPIEFPCSNPLRIGSLEIVDLDLRLASISATRISPAIRPRPRQT